PTSPWHSPASTSIDTSRSAWVSPKAFQTPCATPTEGRTGADPPFTGSITIPPFIGSVTLCRDAIYRVHSFRARHCQQHGTVSRPVGTRFIASTHSGAGLRVAPKVRVVDISLVHDRRRQRVLEIAL